MEHDFDPYREQKGQKSVMVASSDAVVNPRAVVVKSFDTGVADRAMSGSR